MKLRDLFRVREGMDDDRHQETLDRTGFWGRAGAGCVFLAQSTGRLLLAHRSRAVEQPGTWGTWGGAIDSGEDPADAVRREAQEETGYHGPMRIEPLYVFTSKPLRGLSGKGGFRYSNFLAVVPREFEPTLDWENQGARWCDWGDWPTPLHFGLAGLFADPESAETMRRLSRAAKDRTQGFEMPG